MNPAAVLALIAELYERVATLTEENQRLTQQVQAAGEPQP